jgi:ABC-type uncharacterized transport system auxiliary subunit
MKRLLIWLGPTLLLAAGCSTEPAVVVNRYLVSYPPPKVNSAPLPTIIKIRRFQAAAVVQGQSLLWRPGPYTRIEAVYSQWQVSPSDMVTDFLSRDFAASRLYRAVLRPETEEPAPFEVEGVLLALYGQPGRVVISVQISLLKPLVLDTSRRVIFQKTYRRTGPLKGEGPEAMVAAISRTMGRLSARLQEDIYRAIKADLAAQVKPRRR